MLDTRTGRRRWLISACVLALASGARADTGRQGRPVFGPDGASAGKPAGAATLAKAEGPVQAAAPASLARARNWWPAALAAVVGAAVGLALAVRIARRARSAPAPAASSGEGWHGIGGPSYAPRPPTVRVEPRSGRVDTAQINGGSVAPQRQESSRAPLGVPADFDAPAFLVSARQSFVRLQSAWDQSDLHELNECTTDEMFNALTHELRVRAGPSRTEVIELTASLLGVETAAGEYRASVRFCGNLKVNGENERLDEVWNLSKPVDGSIGWLLAGIQQLN